MRKLRMTAALCGAVALAVAGAIPSSAHGHDPAPVTTGTVAFTLDGTVLDAGEQVTSVTLDLRRVPGISAARITPSTFTVRAEGRVPDGASSGSASDVAFDVERAVTKVRTLPGGKVELDLASGNGAEGASTLTYLGDQGRNVLLDLDYTIQQNAPITLRNGRDVTVGSFEQRGLVDPEVDAFSSTTSGDGLKYRLYAPARAKGDRPLVVWLHGNGEGGLPGYYGNEVQLRANRGALGFATSKAQRIFGGAYVVAPEVPDTWYNADESGYRGKLRALITELSHRYRIDQSRIHVAGASAGGLMAVELGAAYPETFASVVTAAPALNLFRTGDYLIGADEVVRLADTPTWFIQSRDDATVPFEKASVWAHDLLPGSELTLYDTVTWAGETYPGHWSWIYLAHDDPATARGTHVWEWMSRQDRAPADGGTRGHGGGHRS
ncbi:PHB depolymerase family esterase [Cellulomonas sp. PhB143]|uniref:carboxylesterase family protein n=1 Tax=Cellulomonas sp. PhB143 TaxID=2485186 RepID=UPI000F46B311|nr:PHB depolymerase family esterase [Cellulomonas sp. PhB143]ROS79131.1 putative peptidase [Cellulomonas sp. PhB143]